MSDLTKLSVDELLTPPWTGRSYLCFEAEAVAEIRRRLERLTSALEMIYDKWENGDPC